MHRANSVYIKRTFNCSAAELWNWIVEPSLLVQWFGPKRMTVGRVESDLRMGGPYSIELLKPSGGKILIEGKYLEIEPASKLTFSFQYSGIPSPPPDSIVRMSISEMEAGQCALSFVQEFDAVPADMESRTVAWEGMFLKLHGLIGGGAKLPG